MFNSPLANSECWNAGPETEEHKSTESHLSNFLWIPLHCFQQASSDRCHFMTRFWHIHATPQSFVLIENGSEHIFSFVIY